MDLFENLMKNPGPFPRHTKFCNHVKEEQSFEFLVTVQFSFSVMSDSLQAHEYASIPLQYARLPCPHPFLELTQTHVHRVGGAIQLSHPLLSPSSPTFSLSQHQGIFQ